MTINDGRFRVNGGCGYVHKPPSVLALDEEYISGRRMLLLLKVLYGSCLPKQYGEAAGEGKALLPSSLYFLPFDPSTYAVFLGLLLK